MLKRYFLFLTFTAAILFFWPTLKFQNILSQEDHGRDLYTFAQIAQGKHIYKDMWWEYGPLMPYYYALFNIIFGLKISSVLLGKAVLNVVGCIFFYLASSEVMSPSWAFLAACFFIEQQYDFFYTYNHAGGIVLFLMLLWVILKYHNKGGPKKIFWALGLCLLIGFVKINFGVTALAATLISVAIIQIFRFHKNKKLPKPKSFYILGLLVVPLCWTVIYYFLLHGLTITEINQCLPYFGNNKTMIATPLESIKGYWALNYVNFLKDWLSFLDSLILMTQDPIQLLKPQSFLSTSLALLKFLIYPLIWGSLLAAIFLSFTKKFEKKRLMFWLVQLILGIFIVLNFHEFIVSNIWYRSFWSQPFILFYFFYMISTAISFAPKEFRYIVGLFLISFFSLVTFNGWVIAKKSCIPDKFLSAATGQIYVGNESDWVNTVNTVTVYLNKNLGKDELFFTLPCNSLYYYLTDKPSPSRQTIFYNSFHISTQQEISVIQELKKNKVNYVLLSNRIKTDSPELGIFGKTYCPLLYKYVMTNFSTVWRYGGSWDIVPGWASNHLVMLLKRK